MERFASAKNSRLQDRSPKSLEDKHLDDQINTVTKVMSVQVGGNRRNEGAVDADRLTISEGQTATSLRLRWIHLAA